MTPDATMVTDSQIREMWTKIRDAWIVLLPDIPCSVGCWSVHFEHKQWWVKFDDEDGESRTYSVVEAAGPGSIYGLAFEEV